MKLSCKTVRMHKQICNEILRDPDATTRDKGIANQVLSDMEDKNDDEYHIVWYAGETIRSLLKRMQEKYPDILERFGVTHRFQIAQAPDATSECSSKYLALLLESAVGGIVEGTINRSLQIVEGENYVQRPFHKMSCVNLLPCGRVESDAMNGWMINLFCKQNCKGNETRRVCDITSNPSILNYVAQYGTAIALANDIVPRDSYEPTMMDLCVGWGTMMYELKKGIHDNTKTPIALTDYIKGGNIVVAAGDHYDNWGQYFHHMGKGFFVRNHLSRLAAVLSREHGDLSKLETLDGITFEGDDAKIYDALSAKFDAVELLKKLQDAHYNKRQETSTISIDLSSGGKLGLATGQNVGDDYIYIKRVVPDGLAGRAGAKDGQRIKSINGNEYKGDYNTAMRHMRMAVESRKVDLMVFKSW